MTDTPPPEPTPRWDPSTATFTDTPVPEPLTLPVRVSQEDPELQAIEAALFILSSLAYETRLRALTYIRDRIESDPSVWGTAPSTTGTPAPEAEIAQILAESDSHEWAVLTGSARADYHRRAAALASVGVVLIRGT